MHYFNSGDQTQVEKLRDIMIQKWSQDYSDFINDITKTSENNPMSSSTYLDE